MTRRRCLPASCSKGTSSGHAGARGRSLRAWRGRARPPPAGHSATAPSASVSFGSRSKAAGLVPVCTPSPSQPGHQPSGLLKEKWCGPSGSKLRPQRWQAKCWLWISRRPERLGHALLGIDHATARRGPGPGRFPRCRRSASGLRAAPSRDRPPPRRGASAGGRFPAADRPNRSGRSTRMRT